MTLDQQIEALAPLDSGAIARVAGYSAGAAQFRHYRHAGKAMPRKRLLAIAARLRELADAAERMAGEDLSA